MISHAEIAEAYRTKLRRIAIHKILRVLRAKYVSFCLSCSFYLALYSIYCCFISSEKSSRFITLKTGNGELAAS